MLHAGPAALENIPPDNPRIGRYVSTVAFDETVNALAEAVDGLRALRRLGVAPNAPDDLPAHDPAALVGLEASIRRATSGPNAPAPAPSAPVRQQTLQSSGRDQRL